MAHPRHKKRALSPEFTLVMLSLLVTLLAAVLEHLADNEHYSRPAAYIILACAWIVSTWLIARKYAEHHHPEHELHETT